ncbi:hypothetical protein GCM10007100_06790 [Roseibacillus persicicus]|uniref:Uncharacterized protein n=1 Tax=Roseibacillus persicicus TaxID=454148 RepID=A0A918TFK7_9BACT|nr:hypothetical protein GCM10007100_06790 [Roseibacillus persicicus]
MFSPTALQLIIYGSLLWTGLAFVVLAALFFRDFKNKNLW